MPWDWSDTYRNPAAIAASLGWSGPIERPTCAWRLRELLRFFKEFLDFASAQTNQLFRPPSCSAPVVERSQIRQDIAHSRVETLAVFNQQSGPFRPALNSSFTVRWRYARRECGLRINLWKLNLAPLPPCHIDTPESVFASCRAVNFRNLHFQ
jgi:hypothetical protein